MKLKEMPDNVVVHTPTEAEAKELLDILGKAHKISAWDKYNDQLAYRVSETIPTYANVEWYKLQKGLTILTLAEFKERYCEEDKPQPKFDKGQKVRITNKKHPHYGHKGKVGEVFSYDPKYDRYRINGIPSEWEPGDLEPYTEPETKPTAKETKKSKETFASEELNLCELLKGHEGETFYHLMYGEVECKGIDKDGFIAFTDSKIPTIYDDGKYDQHANVVLYPSHTLYEQYPLDPYTAWMRWQEEQKKYALDVNLRTYDTPDFGDVLYFRTPADRYKCIEEIKAIIEKYRRE